MTNATQIVQQETFTITDAGGVTWRAVRQLLGDGTYRTPDDPSPREHPVDARLETELEPTRTSA